MHQYYRNQFISETSRWNQKAQFPWMMHRILEDAELGGFAHIVSWMPGNLAFRVHDTDVFVQHILPMYFRQTHYKSFQRQLNMWGFECVAKEVTYRTYSHKFFVRGEADLCKHMQRIKNKGTKQKMSCLAAPQSKNVNGVTAIQPPRVVSPQSSGQIATDLDEDSNIPPPSLSPTAQQNAVRIIPRPFGVDLVVDDVALAVTCLLPLLHGSSGNVRNTDSAGNAESFPSSISDDLLPLLVTSQPTVVNTGETFGWKTFIEVDEEQENNSCEDSRVGAKPIFADSPRCPRRSSLDDLVTTTLSPCSAQPPGSSEPFFSNWNTCHQY